MKVKILAALVFGCTALSQPAIANGFHVTDGDTINDGQTIYRLEGIDAPESGQKCNRKGGGSWSCGKAATARINELVIGQAINCIANGHDDYGRTLAVCRNETQELNATMVTEGLAWAFRKYSPAYIQIEELAHAAKRGVWQTNTETPWDYRNRRWQSASQTAPAGCPIKGNINRKGERIYHAPWSRNYDRTRVNVAKDERWFCSEGEATKAGWRAPMWGR